MPISPFMRVMVEPCIMRMLEFTSIHDRIRSMVVSRHWSYMIHLPRLWSNHELTIERDFWCQVNRIPLWFRSILSRLTLYTSNHQHLTHLQHFSNIRHLTLDMTSDSSHPPVMFDVGIYIEALTPLQLISFKCVRLPPNAITALFVHTKDGSSVMNDSDIQPSSLIHPWADTLESLHLDFVPFSQVITGLLQCQWSHLTHLHIWSLQFPIVPDPANCQWLLDTQLVLQQLLTRQHLPVLQHLSIFGRWCSNLPHLLLPEFNLIDGDFLKDIPQELDQLLSYNVFLIIADNTTSLVFPKFYHLPASLTQLRIDQSDALSKGAHFEHLRELIFCRYTYESSYECLSLISHHSLPLLDTLSLNIVDKFYRVDPDLTPQHHPGTIRIMNEMTSLTYLDLKGNVDLPWMWLSNIHHFLNLKRFDCWILNLSESTTHSIGLSRRWEDVTLHATPEEWSRILELWRAQSTPTASTHSIVSSTPLPIRTLSLTLMTSFPVSILPPNLIADLICLTHLTKLTIENLGDDQSTDAMKALSHLSQLSHLELNGCIPDLSDDILSYWTRVDTESPPFPRLGLLAIPKLTPSLRHSYQKVLEYLVRLPQLHTLQLPHPDSSPALSTHVKVVRAYVRQLNSSGRRPPLELFFDSTRPRVYSFEMTMVNLP